MPIDLGRAIPLLRRGGRLKPDGVVFCISTIFTPNNRHASPIMVPMNWMAYDFICVDATRSVRHASPTLHFISFDVIVILDDGDTGLDTGDEPISY